MKIFLDFDDVVFNAKQFKKDKKEIFKNFGIAEKIFNQYPEEFKKNRKNGELMVYSQDKHIESLENMLSGNGIDFKKLKEELSEFIKGAKKYVFKEFYNFAEKIGKENLFLLTYGDIEYQTEKVKNSGVMDYFTDIIITDGLKSEALSKKLLINNNEACYFIDDRITHLEDVKKKFPEIKTLLMAPENGRHYKEEIEDKIRIDKYCDGVIGNFAEMEKLLEQDGGANRIQMNTD